MEYKGFVARHYYRGEVGVYVGEIVNLQKDVISFGAQSLEKLQEAMVEAVETYILYCQEKESTT